MDFDVQRYRKANPVVLINTQSPDTLCGRFPTVDAALRHLASEGRTVIEVRGNAVYFSEMPRL